MADFTTTTPAAPMASPDLHALLSGLPETCYLFSYFTHNGEDGLRLAWSRDGLKWDVINHGASCLRPKVGRSKLMRDPSVTQGPDGTFHMVWTDSWQSNTIGYASSPDLIHWSQQRAIPVMDPTLDVRNCWAPEIAYDAKRQRFIIFWAATIPGRFPDTEFGGKNDNNHRIYATTTRDFEEFAPAELFFDPGYNCIDATLLSRNGKFYMFFKDETRVPAPMKNLHFAVADDIAGPYHVEAAPVTQPGVWAEGPAALQVGEDTFLYYDAYMDHHYAALRSRDLKTWEDVTAQLRLPKGIRHGTAFAVAREVVARLLARDATTSPEILGYSPYCANPILPGYYADPSLVQHEGKAYLYATLDPWGDRTLGCWESDDFKDWTYRVLNWPTKQACTSPTSKHSMVWAPSVVRGGDGRFFMYVTVGSEVWAGVADHPLGPWHNLLGDRPLIAENYYPGYHMIDAEAFIDDDGAAYLYWGSGLNWVNGRCWVVRLKPDMAAFDGEPKEVTPANYFEAPFMVKHGSRYYLMYSQGITTEDSYQVHYAIGDTPFGPFAEASNSPVLVTDRANNIVAPGHHAVFKRDGHHYILYHRHSIPFPAKSIGRQVCVDVMRFTPEGLIEKVTPTHEGPSVIRGRSRKRTNLAEDAVATASSQRDSLTGPERVLDGNYATRWAASPDALGGWLQFDLGPAQPITQWLIRPEFAWKPYHFAAQSSLDGACWETQADFMTDPISGSPITINKPMTARYLRLVFPEALEGPAISLFEWAVF